MAKRKILIIKGSPRKGGNSSTLAKEVAKGAKAQGAEIKSIYLHELNINPCSGCEACQEAKDKDCIIDDDMKNLYPKIKEADALVFASPIYWFTYSAQTKLFIDRCFALIFIQQVEGEDGPTFKLETDLAEKKIGIILTYGDRDPYISGAINAIRTFQDMFRYIGSEIVGMVYGSALAPGEISSNKELMKQAFDLGKKLGT